MFFRLIKYDLKNGLLKESSKYIISAVMFLLFCLVFVFTKGKAIESKTFGDFMFYITAGMEEYIITPGNIFRFPALWMLLILFPLYITLYYPFNDMNEYGRNILVNSQSKTKWLLSKYIWAAVSVIFYFAVLWGVIACFCLATKAEFSLSVSKIIIYKLIPKPNAELLLGQGNMISSLSIIFAFFMPILVTSAISVLQITISLIIKPFFSFCISVGILIFSSYYLSPFMIGNYAMAQRNVLFISNGVYLMPGVFFCAAVIAISIIIGTVIFRKYDILNKE